MIEDIREQLYQLAEDDYKKFNQKLLPGVERVLGIRIPVLKQLAKSIAKNDAVTYLNEAEEKTHSNSIHEEIMLQGLVLGYAKMKDEERVRYLDEFIPKIQNWAVCDSCVMNMKFMGKNPKFWYVYIWKYSDSQKEYELRFLIVSILAHFVTEDHIDEILTLFGKLHHDGYYVKMAVAWAVSVCYVKYPKKTRTFLEDNQMDDFTHNKSIQKIRESYRVTAEEKETLKTLKRTKKIE